MEMKISSRKDAMGSFIYAMIHDRLLDAVASSIWKRPESVDCIWLFRNGQLGLCGCVMISGIY